MWKKTVPITAALTTLLLAGCNMNNDVPDTNETPMEDVQEDVREGADDVQEGADNLIPDPNVNTESPTETNDDNGAINNNGTETNDLNKDEDKDMNKDTNSPNEEIIEDDLDMNDNNNNDK